MADVPADRVSACYEILQPGTRAYDRECLRSILVPALDFDARIAVRVQGAERTGSPAASRDAPKHSKASASCSR
jgi:hypothetical protein